MNTPEISEAVETAISTASEPIPSRNFEQENSMIDPFPDTAQVSDPPMPKGATADPWKNDDYPVRSVWAQIGVVATSADLLVCPTVTLAGEQFRGDGRIDDVEILIDGDLGTTCLSMTQSLELAALLCDAFVLAAEWIGARG